MMCISLMSHRNRKIVDTNINHIQIFHIQSYELRASEAPGETHKKERTVPRVFGRGRICGVAAWRSGGTDMGCN